MGPILKLLRRQRFSERNTQASVVVREGYVLYPFLIIRGKTGYTRSLSPSRPPNNTLNTQSRAQQTHSRSRSLRGQLTRTARTPPASCPAPPIYCRARFSASLFVSSPEDNQKTTPEDTRRNLPQDYLCNTTKATTNSLQSHMASTQLARLGYRHSVVATLRVTSSTEAAAAGTHALVHVVVVSVY